MEQTYQSLSFAQTDGVMTISLLGPGKGNAMGPEFWEELPRAMDELNRMSNVRCIVFRGSGDHFSYGLNVMQMLPRIGKMTTGTILAHQRVDLMAQIRHMQSGFQKMHESPKPVIAAVHGWCIGGGLNMIAAADIRLCSRDAKFSLREVKLAITPDIGGLQFLPQIIGQGFTREMAFTGADYDAAFAERTGLVNHVYDTPDQLFEAADKLAHQIADNPATAVQGAKQVLNYSLNKSIEDGLQYVAVWNSSQLQSTDFSEAMQATQEKRKAEFNKKIDRGY
ncbi:MULTISPECIES: crotonase/enoyl-CoA hydratase family protein [unclassified Spirosoma]|uniref:crotonase/enoyl-CoA hydratase family protein n=1 Tax=unclassified Spirosoma TaxID=2621999 RepID=UPI00095FD068|nr:MULTISPECIES: crotonase/enoyl-CoA hydratase family protein [unclassified Spirosoma]MBN8825553.1 crotonase/enoyl-CoA hydratase family protein [Spirosoma sp.]OJW74199.1 MAG: enoyl-CoA hydratase [Spirosoma sp. 48-14]